MYGSTAFNLYSPTDAGAGELHLLDARRAGFALLTTSRVAVETPIDDGRYGPCDQSDTRRAVTALERAWSKAPINDDSQHMLHIVYEPSIL